MNSMLMEREARKWEEEKRNREMEEKEIKDKELMEICGKNQVGRSKTRGNKDSGDSSQRTRTETATALVILTNI